LTKKPLLVISKEVKMLYEKAQQQRLTIKDCGNATFTISNLGMLGIDSFTAIVNLPAACILAVGAMQQIPIVQEDQILPAHMLKVTLSCDHRVVDGAVGALFLATFKELMEQPFTKS
jgi:pyruvate dehydrogenase E2 component (dihydrolipoamide acetyltransferase)